MTNTFIFIFILSFFSTSTPKVSPTKHKNIKTYENLFRKCQAQGAIRAPRLLKSNFGTSKGPKNTLLFQHSTFLGTELCAIEKFSGLLKVDPITVCSPEISKMDCAFDFFRGKLRTSAGLVGAMTTVSSADDLDRSLKPEHKSSSLEYIDRAIQMIEHTPTENLYVRTLKTKNGKQAEELRTAKKWETKEMNNILKIFSEMAEKDINQELSASENPTTTQLAQSVRDRLTRLKSKSMIVQ